MFISSRYQDAYTNRTCLQLKQGESKFFRILDSSTGRAWGEEEEAENSILKELLVMNGGGVAKWMRTLRWKDEDNLLTFLKRMPAEMCIDNI